MADEKAASGEMTEDEKKADEYKLKANEFFKGMVLKSAKISMIFNLFEYRKNKSNGVEGINDKIEDSRIFRIRATSRHFYKK